MANDNAKDTNTKFSTDTRYEGSTPADIVEIWKAGDYFGILQLCRKAEFLMPRRLIQSAESLNVHSKPHHNISRGCATIIVANELCGHFILENRVCPVYSSQGNVTFRVREPEIQAIRNSVCVLCEKRMRNEEPSSTACGG